MKLPKGWNQEMVDDINRREEMASELLKKDPKLSYLAAFIIAGDMLGVKRAEKMLADGTPFDMAIIWVGSYGRLDFAVKAYKQGYTTLDHLLDLLPELWRGSDPDDTDTRFADLWMSAWLRNGRKTITDGKPLPAKKVLTIYRGQDEDGQTGIAWTLDKRIASKFAHGAATRQHNRSGIIFQGKVAANRVIAYLTGRGEEEIIVIPVHIKS